MLSAVLHPLHCGLGGALASFPSWAAVRCENADQSGRICPSPIGGAGSFPRLLLQLLTVSDTFRRLLGSCSKVAAAHTVGETINTRMKAKAIILMALCFVGAAPCFADEAMGLRPSVTFAEQLTNEKSVTLVVPREAGCVYPRCAVLPLFCSSPFHLSHLVTAR